MSAETVLRIGIKLKSSCLVVEYEKKGKKRHRKFYLEDYIVQNYLEMEDDELIKSLIDNVLKKHHSNLINQILDEQVERLIQRIIDYIKKKYVDEEVINPKNSITNKPLTDPEAMVQKKFLTSEDVNSLIQSNVNLNKLNDEGLKQVKKHMERDFEKNLLKPGDKGYVYDKTVDFSSIPKKTSSWDD
ncbi:hypothetical protein ABK040_013821 [Willaertia magna]